MVCSNCGAQNPPGSKFCLSCGSPLAITCRNCGATLPAGSRFCNECGTPLAPVGQMGQGTGTPAEAGGSGSGPTVPGSAATTPTPAAERRLVSVLFADLVGFTTVSESRDAEEVRDLLSAYFDTCRTLVGRYGGTIEKFIGDA